MEEDAADEEEEGAQEDDEQNSLTGTDKKNPLLYTARDKLCVRSVSWSKEERVALFYNCLRNFDVLKKKGPDKSGTRKDTWKLVQGGYQ